MADKIFTYGTSNVDGLLSTTLSSVRKKFADTIFNNSDSVTHCRSVHAKIPTLLLVYRCCVRGLCGGMVVFYKSAYAETILPNHRCHNS